MQSTKPSPKPEIKVLISGAGIAGSCLAYWLARTGQNMAITVVERAKAPRITGQAVDVRGPAIEVVEKMGLLDKLREMHTTETGMSILGASGKSQAVFKGGDTFTAQYEILRADLAGMFIESTEQSSNITYRYGDFVQSLDQDEKHANVTFASGAQESYELVVAADGSTSRTRSLILDNNVTEGCSQFIGQYTAFFSIPSKPTDTKEWYWYACPGGIAAMIRPHRTSETMGSYLCITTPGWDKTNAEIETALKAGEAAQKKILRKYFQGKGWQVDRILAGMDACEDFYMSKMSFVKLPKWTNGRALVVGDAAWATFGIGTSLAIDGAYVLAGELSKIKSLADIPQALEDYERVFRGLYDKVEGFPSVFPQIAFPQSALGLSLVRTALWFVAKTRLYKMFPDDEVTGWEFPAYDWQAMR